MEYVYAALLLDEAGKEINEKSLQDVVKAAGFTPDEARAKAMVASLKDVNIKEVIKNAQAAPVAVAVAAPAAGAKEEKKEEKKAEKTEEENAGGLAGLFG
jgi:large subunit ribosomal protein L12